MQQPFIWILIHYWIILNASKKKEKIDEMRCSLVRHPWPTCDSQMPRHAAPTVAPRQPEQRPERQPERRQKDRTQAHSDDEDQDSSPWSSANIEDLE